jgi:glutathione S-transferase
MKLPILYSFRRCPYAMRGRLAIAGAGIQVELREVLLRDKPLEMLEVSSKGTVPVLVLPNGQIIEESFDIMKWALGAKTITNNECNLVLLCDTNFKPWLDQYKYPNNNKNYNRETTLEKSGKYLNLLEAHLQKNKFLFGGVRGFADIGIAPFIRQFANVDIKWFLESNRPNLIAWYQEFIEWDGFEIIMIKHPRWFFGDPITLFP